MTNALPEQIRELEAELVEWQRRLEMTPKHHTRERRKFEHNITMTRRDIERELKYT